ncbi:hypothetical protein ACNKHR_15510 [Shigella flexneri]
MSGKRDGEAERATAQAEEKLGDSELYDQSRKAELTACLHRSQRQIWLEAAKWHGRKPLGA